MIGERLAGRPLALERLDGLRPRRRLLGRQFIFGRGRFQLFELKLHLLQQPRLALRAGAIELAPQLLDLEPEWLISASVPAFTACALAATASASRRAARSARIIACAAARSVGSDSKAVTPRRNHIHHHPQSKSIIPPTSAATSPADVANRCQTADNRVAPARSSPHRRPGSATRNDRVPDAS